MKSLTTFLVCISPWVQSPVMRKEEREGRKEEGKEKSLQIKADNMLKKRLFIMTGGFTQRIHSQFNI